MGIFKKLMRQGAREKLAVSPLSGEVVLLESVKDPVFAEKTLGDGVGIIPSKGSLMAPADGVIAALFPTGHALGLQTADGMELLIHIGIDTVELKGQGFEVHVAAEEKVKQGQLLVTFDIEKIREAGYDPTTMVLVSNGEQFGALQKRAPGEVKAGDKLLWF